MLKKRTAVLAFFAAGSALHSGSGGFPAEYRQWVHVKSAIVGPSSPMFASEGGIHHIYANPTALTGLRTGEFADGSVLVYDLLTLDEKNGVASEVARRRVDVMLKDLQAYPASGGWYFERYLGDDRSGSTLTEEQRAACFNCHSARRGQGFVFSRFRI